MIIRKCFRTAGVCRRVAFNYHNFYDTLEVDQGASQEDIKRKYYELAKRYHPDAHKDTQNSQKFVKINEAYEVLGDEKKRKNYDNSFFSRQYYHYDNNNYGSGYESARERKAREAEEKLYN